jgi:hypothetical protein
LDEIQMVETTYTQTAGMAGDTTTDNVAELAQQAVDAAAAAAADLLLTDADTVATAADRVATNQDTIDTAADLVATNQDTIDTAADAVSTAADVVTTNADAATTTQDAIDTAADVVTTNADAATTTQDAIDTAADATAAANSASAASTSASEAAASAGSVTVDAASVTAAGALMDSELASIADVKALNQSVISGATPTLGIANMTLVDTSLVVSDTTNLQTFAEGVDSALLKARGTGFTSTYVSTVTVGGTTFAQPAVNGEIYSDQGYFSIAYAGATGITVATLSSASTYVYIDNAGNLQQQTSTPTRQDWSRKMFTMRIAVDTSAETIIGFEYLGNPIGHYANSIRDLYKALLEQGVPFKGGQTITGRAADLGFDVSAGTLMEFGGTGNIDNANVLSFDAVANAEYTLIERTGAGTAGQTNLVKSWDNAGSITASGSGTFVGHRVYRFSNGNLVIQYGQGNYANLVLARAGILLEDYILNERLLNATFFGWWIIGETATNTGGTTLTEFREYTIGVQGGSSSSFAGCLLQGNNLSDLLDVSAARTNLGLGTAATTDASDYATLASPTFTGTPAVPTASLGTDTTQVASTAFVLANGASGLVGDLTFTSRTTIPTGSLRTDGATYLQSAYPALFAVVGLTLYDPGLKLADPSDLPPGAGYTPSFSSNGVYLAVSSSTSPYLIIYKRSGDVFTKLADPASLPAGIGFDAAFSPDSTYLSIAHNTTPFLTIYKRSGDVFTKLADPASLPAGRGQGTAFSADGVYLAVSMNTTPFITVYKRAGDVFTKLSDPASLPAGQSNSVAFSADGVYMSVAHVTSPFVTIYKRAGDVFTKLSDPAALPTGSSNGAAFSPDNTYLSITHNTTPFITNYKRSGDVFTKLPDPSFLPTGNGQTPAFSNDGTLLAVAHVNANYLTIYKRSGDVFTKLSDVATPPNNNALGLGFDPNDAFLAVGSNVLPFVSIYKNAAYDTATEFKVPLVTRSDTNVIIKAE